MQQDAEAVVDCAVGNHLKLNPDKIKSIIVGSAIQLSKVNNLQIPAIMVSNTNIPYSTSVTNLGVILTPTLNWSAQVMRLSKSVHYTLHRLRLKSRLLSYELLKLLVNSLIIPFFDDCYLVYDALDVILMDKIEGILNLAIRFIFGIIR